MADFSTYDTTNSPSGPEKPRVFGLKVLNDIDNLRQNGINDGTISLVKGYLQAFTDGSDRVYFKVVREDGSTVKEAMAGEYFLREPLDFDGQTSISFRVEDAAALPLAAENDGIISRDPTSRRLIKNGPVGGVRHYLSEFSLDGLSYRRSILRLANLNGFGHAYGSMLAASGGGTVIQLGIDATPVTLAVWDQNEESAGTIPDHTTDDIEIITPGLYLITGQLSTFTSAATNMEYTFGLNGVDTGIRLTLSSGRSSAADIDSISASGFINLKEGDKVSIFVSASTGTVNLTVGPGSFNVLRIGPDTDDNTGTPAVRNKIDGYLMQDALDSIYFVSREPLPADYSGAHDVLVEALVMLEDVELSTDTIDMKATYEKATLGLEPFDGTTTVATNTAVTIGAGTAAGTLHRVIMPMPFNDANNPLAGDDMLRGVLQRDGLANVGDIIVLGANLLVPCYGGVDHQ